MVLLLASVKQGSCSWVCIHECISQCSLLVFPVPYEGADINTLSTKENGTEKVTSMITDGRSIYVLD